jgi:hypothetical protein
MRKFHISVDFSALQRTKWYEYLLRFIFGGAITAIAGIIAKRFGPEIGGLFLAFPAIFPASATLIEKHEKQKKRKAGLDGTIRGRQAAGLDAAGASLGSIGLIAFALVFWLLIPHAATWLVLLAATLVWIFVSGSLWRLRKTKFGLRSFLSRFHKPVIESRKL